MCGTHRVSGVHEIAAEKDNELVWRIQRAADRVRFIRRNRSNTAGTVAASTLIGD